MRSEGSSVRLLSARHTEVGLLTARLEVGLLTGSVELCSRRPSEELALHSSRDHMHSWVGDLQQLSLNQASVDLDFET